MRSLSAIWLSVNLAATARVGAAGSAGEDAAVVADADGAGPDGGSSGFDALAPEVDAALEPDAAPEPDAALGPPIVKGLNEHPIWYAPSDPDLLFDLDSDLGVQATRADCLWSEIHPDGPTDFNDGRVAKMDAYMDAMHARGVRVTLIALSAPAWASIDGQVGSHRPPAPEHIADFADFCAWLVDRYCDRGLEAIEIWNEPAGYWAWYPSGDDGVAYTALLKAAYPAVKAAAALHGADVKVLGVSLFSGGQDARDRTLLDNIYAQGGRDFFDVMSVHVYPKHTTSGSPTSPFYDAGDLTSSIVGLWEHYTLPMMIAAGDGGKKVWMTEVGVQTGSTGDATREQQAAAVTDYFTTFQSGVLPPNVERVYWYQLVDKEGAADNGWGLVNNAGSGTQPVAADLTFKPSYTAFRDLVP